MRHTVTRSLIACVAILVFVRSAKLVADDAVQAQVASVSAATPRGAGKQAQAPVQRATRPTQDEQRAVVRGQRDGESWIAQERGRRIEFSVEPALQERAQRLFQEYGVPYASVVALDPHTGRVLAYVNHLQEGAPRDLAREASAPAASVFKLVTSAALIEAGVSPDRVVCYSGGYSRIDAVHLQDHPRRDRACIALDDALGKSTNAVFAKLADRYLNPAALSRHARAFGFGRALPFGMSAQASPLALPHDDTLEFARAAAGFWHSYMSPLHAALIAATFANDGAMVEPWIVKRVVREDGQLVRQFGPTGVANRVVPASIARSVGHMMLRTVRDGTSRSAFLDARGRPALPGIAVAGKTGSLSQEDPYRAYSWWVGYAPADQPKIALAALVVNEPKWRIKSSLVARELLREYLISQPEQDVAARSRKR